MMQPAALTVGHDAFLVLGASGIQRGRNHRIIRIENRLWINTEHVAPVLTAAHVETRRHVPSGGGCCFFQRCEKGSFEVIVLSLKRFRVLLLPDSMREN